MNWFEVSFPEALKVILHLQHLISQRGAGPGLRKTFSQSCLPVNRIKIWETSLQKFRSVNKIKILPTWSLICIDTRFPLSAEFPFLGLSAILCISPSVKLIKSKAVDIFQFLIWPCFSSCTQSSIKSTHDALQIVYVYVLVCGQSPLCWQRAKTKGPIE